jgi:large subunit ribosomal protein L27
VLGGSSGCRDPRARYNTHSLPGSGFARARRNTRGTQERPGFGQERAGFAAEAAGIKLYAGESTNIGSIIVTQCGTKYAPGRYVRRAKNDSLFALAEGKVYFDQGGKRVNVMPTDPANANV